jgi:hypothetical protein
MNEDLKCVLDTKSLALESNTVSVTISNKNGEIVNSENLTDEEDKQFFKKLYSFIRWDTSITIDDFKNFFNKDAPTCNISDENIRKLFTDTMSDYYAMRFSNNLVDGNVPLEKVLNFLKNSKYKSSINISTGTKGWITISIEGLKAGARIEVLSKWNIIRDIDISLC